jgi:hypothetical protein
MENGASRTPSSPPAPLQGKDVESSVREREARASVSRRKSDPNLSLDQRIEQKLHHASRMLARLGKNDPRARLLQIAIMRRDESLLDGVLIEIGSSRPPARHE